MDLNQTKDTGCCSRFNPKPWDEKEIVWNDKLFIKDRVRSIFHIPINFGKIMIKNTKMIENADACSYDDVLLSDENSLWGADLYIGVTKEIETANNVKISGTFLTKVFEGPYKNMKNWISEMRTFVISKNKEIKKMYFFYTTCPKCAKVYGKNFIVIFAEV